MTKVLYFNTIGGTFYIDQGMQAILSDVRR